MSKLLLNALCITGLLATIPATASADPPRAYIQIHVGTRRPPPPRREVRVVSPGRGYVWIPGSWDLQSGEWVWIAGRWERPAQHVYWVRARYVPEYGHWRYVPAHWSNQTVDDGDDYRSWKEEHQRQQHDRDQNRSGHPRK